MPTIHCEINETRKQFYPNPKLHTFFTMQRVNLVDMYSTPDFYKPPAADQLTNNTQYPNLNSLEYQKRTAPVTGPTSVRRNFFDFLRVNGLGNAVLVANRYTDRKWHGHFWGFECLEDVRGVETSPAASDKVSYELCCKDTVTGVRFIDDNMVRRALCGRIYTSYY